MRHSVFLILLLGMSHNAFPNDKPNIVFILADDMGYSDMSWQGSSIQTPNLDKLAEEGMFLSRNYVQPQCTPTRIAFLTGNYPYRYGLHEHVLMTNSMHGIPGDEKTIAEKMKEGGYRTALIGKWHAGCHLESQLPNQIGFDHAFYCLHGAISYWNYTAANNSTMVRNGQKYYAPSMEDGETSGNTYATELWKKEASELIQNHDSKQPLFLYLAFNAPHYPLHAPEKTIAKYRDLEVDAYWSGPDAALGRNAENRKLYMAMVDAMDAAIGEVISALEEKGMLENTLIVFCSDNGGIEEADNRPLRSYKGDSFEGGVRVPGIAFWPGKIKPGSTSRELVYVADWYATFAEIAGMETAGEQKDGVSALDILMGNKGKRDHIPIISAARHAYITGRFSLVGGGENYQGILNRSFSDFRLYDLDKDLSQQYPVRGLPEVKERMKEGLEAHFSKTNRGCFNWDMKYGKYRKREPSFDHDLDHVINDRPKIQNTRKGPSAGISISPVSDELKYTLQKTTDGSQWTDLATYVCRQDAEAYQFPSVMAEKKVKEYRVLTQYHYGLPIHDPFDLEVSYSPGPLEDVPPIEGCLPYSKVSGGEQARILENSLIYSGMPAVGGSLELDFNNVNEEPSFTRFFIQPFSSGKVFASMLLQFEGRQEESVGEVNWLVQNGWNGPTEKQASLRFQQDGIYIDKADPVPPHTRKWLAEHNREVLRILIEFDLGPIGEDVLKVYINPPEAEELPIPHAVLRGEFTFDRLQFRLTRRPGSTLTVDELHIGRQLSDVL